MLKSKQLQKYFNKREDKMLHHLKSFKKKKDQEDLHRFRVEVKKVNALAYLLKHSANKFDISDKIRTIKKMYNQAGIIRTAYVNMNILKNDKQKNRPFYKDQNRLAKEKSKEFISKAAKFSNNHKTTFDAIQKHLKGVKNKFVLKLYKKELEKAAKISFNTSNPDDLHKCRKKIKKLLYIYDVLSESLMKKINLNTVYLKKLEEKIGSWHDSILLAKQLKEKKYSDKKIMAQIIRQQKVQLKQLSILSDDFLKKSLQL